MTEPNRSKPFVASDDNFLWDCLTSRSSGVPLSQRLGIAEWVLAYDLDKAVSLRLLVFDREQMEHNAKLIAYEVSKMFGDGSESSSDSSSGGVVDG